MIIANTDQAERWNSGDDVAHWTRNQERYDRMNEPFLELILEAAALRPGSQVLDVGCGAAHRAGPGGRPRPVRPDAGPGPGRRRIGRPRECGVPAGRRPGAPP